MAPNGQCVCANCISCTHSILVFAFPHTNQQAIELHFNNEANSQLFFFCYAQKFGNMVECSVMLGAKRVHALFSAFRPYIKIQMRTLSMNMHKLVVRYEANLNNNAAPIASYCGCHWSRTFLTENYTNNVWEKHAWALLPEMQTRWAGGDCSSK